MIALPEDLPKQSWQRKCGTIELQFNFTNLVSGFSSRQVTHVIVLRCASSGAERSEAEAVRAERSEAEAVRAEVEAAGSFVFGMPPPPL